MFPMMGLFLIFIPIGGFLLALLLCFIRPFRFLATFAFLIPLLGSYSAIAGFWGVGIAVERAGFHRWLVNFGGLLGLLGGGALGASLGSLIAFGFNRLTRRIATAIGQG